MLLADVGTEVLLSIIGLVISVTGIVHLVDGFAVGDLSRRRWHPGRPLGILELGLGVTLIVTAGASGSVSTWLASAWALLSGVVLVLDALLIRHELITGEISSPG